MCVCACAHARSRVDDLNNNDDKKFARGTEERRSRGIDRKWRKTKNRQTESIKKRNFDINILICFIQMLMVTHRYQTELHANDAKPTGESCLFRRNVTGEKQLQRGM